MTRTLILGGTGWLGREIASAAIRAGSEVICVARGESGDVPDGARLVRADRRDPDALDAVTGEFDSVIEISSDPALVESALRILAPRAAHWTYVSTVSVYARGDQPDADESAELVEPHDLSQFADAKVAAERASAELAGDRLFIVRPGLIVGPGDPTDRFGYWPARLDRPGPVLSPTTADRHVQVIDVADLAAGIVRASTDRATGAMNAVGLPVEFAAFLDLVAEATGSTAERIEVDDETLLAHDVNYWAGPRSLPLWLPATERGFARRDGSAFRAAAGGLRPLRETIDRTLEDERRRGVDRERRSGMTLAEERDVLDQKDR